MNVIKSQELPLMSPSSHGPEIHRNPCKHTKHLIKPQHLECRPVHVRVVSLPLAALAR